MARPLACGNELTIADYFGAALVSIGELVDRDLAAYPNIERVAALPLAVDPAQMFPGE